MEGGGSETLVVGVVGVQRRFAYERFSYLSLRLGRAHSIMSKQHMPP